MFATSLPEEDSHADGAHGTRAAFRNVMSKFKIIDDEVLSTVVGGETPSPTGQQPPADGAEDPPRTWGQVGREYVAACAQGAATSLMFSGKPRNKRAAAATAGMGCLW